MAEEKRQLIFEVEFNADAGIEKAAKLRKQIEEDKKALAILNKEIDSNTEATLEQRVEREKLETLIKSASKERATELKMVENYMKATNNATTADGKANQSRKQLQATLSFLTEKWSNLTEEERENTDAGKNLSASIKETSDKLKGMEMGVGNTYRNVGNYTESIEKAISGNSKFSDGIVIIKGGFEEFKNAAGLLKNQIKGVADAEGGAQKASLAFGLSLKAIGIGLLISLIAGALSYLSKFDAGMDKVEQVTKGAAAAIETFVKGLAPIGKLVVDAFTNPIGTVKKLVKGTDEYKVSLDTLVASSVKAGMATAELTKQFQDLEDAEDSLTFKRKQADNQVRLALLATKDRNKTEKEKLAILDAAGAKEKEVSDQELTNAEKNLRLTRERIAIEAGFTNARKMSNEQLEKLMDSEKVQDAQRNQSREAAGKLIDAEASRDEALQRIQNRRSAFLDEIAAKEKARREKAAAAALKEFNEMMDRLKKENDSIQKTAASLGEIRAKQREEERAAKDEFLKLNDEQAQAAIKRWEDYYKTLSDKRKKALQEEADKLVTQATMTSDFVQSVGGMFAQSLAEQQFNAQEFAKNFLFLMLDMVEKTVIAKVAASIAASAAESFAQPDSVATFGATGIARTIVLTGLIKAGFSVFKGVLSGLMSAPAPKATAAEGGILVGPSHASGGITGTGSFANIEVEGGEAILTKKATAMFAPMLSIMNQLGGGKPLANTRFAAAGGYLNPALPVTTRNYISNTGATIIDYNKLADAMAKRPTIVRPSELKKFENNRNVTIARASIG